MLQLNLPIGPPMQAPSHTIIFLPLPHFIKIPTFMLRIHIGRWSHLPLHPIVRYDTRISLAHETLTENLNAMVCDSELA